MTMAENTVRCRGGHELEEGVLYCPRCGAPRPAAATPADDERVRKERRFRFIVFGGLGVLFAGFIAYAIIWGGEKSGYEANDRLQVQAACEIAVEQLLVSPGSADFGRPRIVTRGDQVVVTGVVDSQNGFGALLRSSFECGLAEDADGRWRVVDVDVR